MIMNFGIILVLPLLLTLSIPLGIIQLFTTFGILFALPSGALIIGAGIASKYHKARVALLLVLTAAIGQWLLFFSWIASRHSITPEESTHQWGVNLPSVARSGFPFSSLELPPSPMGNDHVPGDMWSGVFTNEMIWFLVAFAIAAFILSRKNISSKKALLTCTLLIILAALYNLALFTLWYD